MKKPKILITNDDGIYAPGLRHLWQPLVDVADVAIVAPSSEKSGVGLGITLRNPLQIESVKWDKGTPAWKINGTPADCVRLATSVLLDTTPDLIVSGINRGSNAGRNVLYSGTIGGVIEGILRNIPGIAFSCINFDQPNYLIAEKYILSIVQHILEHPLPKGNLLNVNVPDGFQKLKGFKMARQGKGRWVENPEKRIHPEGTPYYWQGGKWHHHEEPEQSDVALLNEGYLTAVPLHVDELTNHEQLASRKAAFENIFTS